MDEKNEKGPKPSERLKQADSLPHDEYESSLERLEFYKEPEPEVYSEDLRWQRVLNANPGKTSLDLLTERRLKRQEKSKRK